MNKPGIDQYTKGPDSDADQSFFECGEILYDLAKGGRNKPGNNHAGTFFNPYADD